MAEARAQREINLLVHDAVLVRRVLTELGRTQPIDASTDALATYYDVTAELWNKVVDHSRAVALLLEGNLFPSAVIVNRAAYELHVNLRYLMTHGDKVRNALLHRARSLLEVAEQFASAPSGQSAVAVLPRMPRDVVEEATRYKMAKRVQPWAGISLAAMAAAINTTGHAQFYAVTSWEAHGRITGYAATTQAVEGSSDLRRVEFNTPEPAPHREALANHTRRNLVRVYALVARDWYGRIPPLATADPFATNEDAKREPPP